MNAHVDGAMHRSTDTKEVVTFSIDLKKVEKRTGVPAGKKSNVAAIQVIFRIFSQVYSTVRQLFLLGDRSNNIHLRHFNWRNTDVTGLKLPRAVS